MVEEVKELTELLSEIEAVAPTIGATRIIAIDGPAGSGKTTLAAQLHSHIPDSVVMHMDYLYEGWEESLTPYIAEKIIGIFNGLRANNELKYRPFLWESEEFGEEIIHDSPAVIILEGVGSGQRAFRSFLGYSIWVWAPETLRLARGLHRDGEHLREQWSAFQKLEKAHFLSEATEGAADYSVNGAPTEVL